ncbi:LuxR C-terminal-related transcriptional regulator [Rhizobium sp. BK251]|uniref:response regulator transcription factor n=1 Tax=Rhizobium sp. BK251 TaxID=2512125 RepID=UPI0010E0A7DC|nr:FixJ family two-component response regulator [Rhizobium sp. BK251]
MESARMHVMNVGHSGKIAPVQTDNPSVVVVDDHADDWTCLGAMLEASGVSINVTSEMPEHLLLGRSEALLCLILDAKPGRDGLDFQRRLKAAKVFVPIIFVTEFGNVPMSVTAMKNGAIDFLDRPCRDEELLESIGIGLARDHAWNEESRRLSSLMDRYDTLTRRERQVMEMVAAGRLNKQIAGDLGVSEITVKVHRGQVMRKMEARSLPELARMADKVAQIVQHPSMHIVTAFDALSYRASTTSELSPEHAQFETWSIVRPSHGRGRPDLGKRLLAS